MKKALLFLAGILSLISFSSCVEKENDSPEALLIGKWYMTQTNTNPSYDGMHRDSYMEFTDTGVVKIVFEAVSCQNILMSSPVTN